MKRWYLDSSAAVKVLIAEPESVALRRFLRSKPHRISSALLAVELVRTVARRSPRLAASARKLVNEIDLIACEPEILAAASSIAPPEIRSLDAIHLVSAMSLGSDLGAVITYDRRMIAAAGAAGIKVESPA